MFFNLSTAAVIAVLVGVVGGAAAVGVILGHRTRRRPEHNSEPVGVAQGTLLGLVGLLLAFGLSMAVGRYESRRSVVLQEGNSIGTTYLRAQLLAEPERSVSLDLLREYADGAVDLARQVPNSGRFRASAAHLEDLQNQLWAKAADAVRKDPTGTAPKLYIETLNDTIDRHSDRVTSLGNRVPGPVMLLEVVAAALAAAVLALYLTVIGRSVAPSLLVAAVLIVILFVSFDLDRPSRGFITVPATPLVNARAAMDIPPAASAP